MKKFMTIVLAAALVFAVAGQASAAALETSGEYRGRFWYLDNYKSDNSSEFWDQRLRLKMGWKVSDTVSVNARADVLENTWQTVGADASEIDFDWANVAFAWGTANLTVGKQDVSWGPGVYAKADNRYRAKIGSKFGENSWSFAWDKMVETGKEFDEDWNGYSLGFVMPLAGWKFGVLGVYSDNKPVDADLLGIDVTAEGAARPGEVRLRGCVRCGRLRQRRPDRPRGLRRRVHAARPGQLSASSSATPRAGDAHGSTRPARSSTTTTARSTPSSSSTTSTSTATTASTAAAPTRA